MSDLLKAAVLGLVEGLTEFLPVSSTGHLIIVNDFVGFGRDFAGSFNIIIQLGAILAVAVYFRRRLFPFGMDKPPAERNAAWDVWKKAALALLPALVIGPLFGKYIIEKLFNHIVVSVALIIGGFVLVAVDRRGNGGSRMRSVGELGFKTVFLIGLAQCAAMVPGVSRSAATIIGAMALGSSRVVAAEFSFFLAIPTITAASAYALMRHGFVFSGPELASLAVGFCVSFAVALVVIAAFMRYIGSRNLRPFGYYRIALGVAVLAYWHLKAGG